LRHRRRCRARHGRPGRAGRRIGDDGADRGGRSAQRCPPRPGATTLHANWNPRTVAGLQRSGLAPITSLGRGGHRRWPLLRHAMGPEQAWESIRAGPLACARSLAGASPVSAHHLAASRLPGGAVCYLARLTRSPTELALLWSAGLDGPAIGRRLLDAMTQHGARRPQHRPTWSVWDTYRPRHGTPSGQRGPGGPGMALLGSDTNPNTSCVAQATGERDWCPLSTAVSREMSSTCGRPHSRPSWPASCHRRADIPAAIRRSEVCVMPATYRRGARATNAKVLSTIDSCFT
jgi:hypothetical protein